MSIARKRKSNLTSFLQSKLTSTTFLDRSPRQPKYIGLNKEKDHDCFCKTSLLRCALLQRIQLAKGMPQSDKALILMT